MFPKVCIIALLCLLGLATLNGAKVANSGDKLADTLINTNTSTPPITPPTVPVPTTTTKDPPTTTTTTVPPPTTTTTVLPPTTTTTVPPPTTTTTIAPPPVVQPGVWNVTENGTNCILAKMAIDFSVIYNISKNETKTVHFTVPPSSNASGMCNKSDESMKLPFANKTGTITFVFRYNTTTKEYSVSSIDIKLAVNNNTFPNNTWVNVTELPFTYKGELFKSIVNTSYTCLAPDSLSFKNPSNVTSSLQLTNVHVEAFGTHKDKNFSAGVDCVTAQTPDIVPIAVGLALALLVIVVLIGFLVSRRRSQARGYLSM